MAGKSRTDPKAAVLLEAGWKNDALLIALALLGGLVFSRLDIPAAWLSGAMVSVIAAGSLTAVLTGRRLAGLRAPWLELTMLLSGSLIGASATPEALAATARYPASIALLIAAMLAIIAATGFFLRRFLGWHEPDASLAAAPGALSTVLAVALERRADLPRIAIVQVLRLFVLVAALPGALVMSGLGGGVGARTISFTVSPLDAALLLGAGLLCGRVLERLAATAPQIVGATLASAVLHATGLVQGTLPGEVSIFAFILLGAMVAGRIATIDAASLWRTLPAAIGAFFVSMTVAAVLAWPAALAAGVPYAAALVAFAPGGLEAMAMLAFAMGLDPLYVGAHHLVRFIAIGMLLPAYINLMAPRK